MSNIVDVIPITDTHIQAIGIAKIILIEKNTTIKVQQLSILYLKHK
jgi:hypothetical protein